MPPTNSRRAKRTKKSPAGAKAAPKKTMTATVTKKGTEKKEPVAAKKAKPTRAAAKPPSKAATKSPSPTPVTKKSKTAQKPTDVAGKPQASAKKTKTVTKKGAGKKKRVEAKKATPTAVAAVQTTTEAATKPKSTAGPKSTTAKKSGPLEVGTDAPDFTVNDQEGSQVSLASFRGSKNVVVYFYPKDNTLGCSKEACKFRDLKDEYDALGCVVLGVSADHETSHGKFIAKYSLNFSLLADTNRALIKAYGASKPGDKIQRSTVLINKEGKVVAVWNPVSGAEKHPNEVLSKLKEISSA